MSDERKSIIVFPRGTLIAMLFAVTLAIVLTALVMRALA